MEEMVKNFVSINVESLKCLKIRSKLPNMYQNWAAKIAVMIEKPLNPSRAFPGRGVCYILGGISEK